MEKERKILLEKLRAHNQKWSAINDTLFDYCSSIGRIMQRPQNFVHCYLIHELGDVDLSLIEMKWNEYKELANNQEQLCPEILKLSLL